MLPKRAAARARMLPLRPRARRRWGPGRDADYGRQLLAPRWEDDAGDDLWRTFNRVQENAIRGGRTAWGRHAQTRPRRVTSREVTGIDGDMRLNRALWTLTERMAELKGAG